VDTPFGVSWEQLDLESLRTFLADPVHEGITWEAKGGNVRREHVLEAVCAFGNSDLGGYLVIGTSQDRRDETWTVNGHAFPDEPGVWIANCLDNGGVDPVPSTDTKSWSISQGSRVAVVQIYPVAITPCLTSSGEVWQRLSGKSQRVTDAATLRRLFERGEAARSRAMATAEAGRDDLIRASPEGRHLKVVVSIATPSLPADVSAAVFRRSTVQLVQQTIEGSGQRLGGGTSSEVSQHAVTVWSTAPWVDLEGCAIRVGRHGSVAVGFSNPDHDSGLPRVAQGTYSPEQLWTAATTITRELGGYGPAAMAMHLHDPVRGATSIARWTEVRPPTREELQSIVREASRADGRPVWEPE
jgi:schlafen family protein